MTAEATLTIGLLAKEAGVGVETLRFYERKQLITEPPRRASGYRQYPVSAIARIKFIKRAKELGFSLKEIDELLPQAGRGPHGSLRLHRELVQPSPEALSPRIPEPDRL